MKTKINNQTGPVLEASKITATAGSSEAAVPQLFSALPNRCLEIHRCCCPSRGQETRLGGTSGCQKCGSS